jgi:hypothetical protein
MLRQWYEDTVNDGTTFRRRFRWAMVALWLAEVATIVAVVIRT